MPVDLQETRMPGVGVKYTLRLHDGGRIAVILHNDGTREVYWFRHAADEEPRAVITLDDDEARQLGAVVGGAYERPKIVEDLEMALGERQPEPVTGAQPGDTIERGDTLVTVGKAGQYPEFRRLLRAGDPGGSPTESS